MNNQKGWLLNPPQQLDSRPCKHEGCACMQVIANVEPPLGSTDEAPYPVPYQGPEPIIHRRVPTPCDLPCILHMVYMVRSCAGSRLFTHHGKTVLRLSHTYTLHTHTYLTVFFRTSTEIGRISDSFRMSSDALFISCRGAHAEYNVEDRTNDITEQILTYPGAHRGVQVCGSDLLGPRRRPPKAGHSPPLRLRCRQRRRQRLWREGAASGEAFLQRHGSGWRWVR